MLIKVDFTSVIHVARVTA